MDARQTITMITVNKEVVDKYIKGQSRHASYDEAVNIADHLSFHIDGFQNNMPTDQKYDVYAHLRPTMLGRGRMNPYFKMLIGDRRPNESDAIKLYRRKIYASITKEPMFKVISSLNKIVRSEDWKIDYSQVEKPPKIRDGEHLEDYCEKNYPIFGSLTNWVYTYGLKKILGDPNAMMAVIPIGQEDDNEFIKPFANFIPSINVLFYEPSELLIYKSDITGEFKSKSGQAIRVPIFKVITKEGIWNVQQINDLNEFDIVQSHTLNLEELPVFIVGSVIKEIVDNIPLYDSFLAPMLPRLDEASREYSDMQAEVVQHIHSTLAVFQGQDCSPCSGTGKVIKDGKPVVCGDCKGKGAMQSHPQRRAGLRRVYLPRQ